LSIFRRKPAPDLIRGGHRLGVENAAIALNLERIPIPSYQKSIQFHRDALCPNGAAPWSTIEHGRTPRK
jgi:hypothetical protein